MTAEALTRSQHYVDTGPYVGVNQLPAVVDVPEPAVSPGTTRRSE